MLFCFRGGTGKWKPFRFWRWVVFISGCSDATVTSTAENKPVAPGSLPWLCSSSPHFSACDWDSSRKRSKAGCRCGLAMERTSSQSLNLSQRAESSPLHWRSLLCFEGQEFCFGFSSTRNEGKVKGTHLAGGLPTDWQVFPEVVGWTGIRS